MANIYGYIEEEELTDNEKMEMLIAFLAKSFPFVLCPTLFSRVSELPNLEWTKVKYSEHESHDFPDQQGVYIFSIHLEHSNLPMNSYVMYVGKAGDITSANTIAKRFRDYVNYSGYKDRPRVSKMLKHYTDYLYYHYAEIPDGTCTEDVEIILNDIFVPPCSQRDFTADVRSWLRGVRLA